MSYFRGAGTPRPVERVLPAVERLEFREAGSPFEARLRRDRPDRATLRPVANRQGARPDRRRTCGSSASGCRGSSSPAQVGARRRRLCRAGRPAPGGRRRRPRAAPGLRAALVPRRRPGRGGTASRAGSDAASRPAAAPAERAAHAAAAVALADRARGRRRPHRPAPRAPRRARRRPAVRGGRAAARRRGGAASGRPELRRGPAGPHAARRRAGAHRDRRSSRRSPSPTAWSSSSGRCRAPATRRSSRRRSPPTVARAVRGGPGHEGPHAVPAERRDEALHVAAAFARPASSARRGRRRGERLRAAVGAARDRV